MIAVDTSVIVALALGEEDTLHLKPVLGKEALLIGWPTLLETRIVLSAKGFSNANAIVDKLVTTPNVTAVAFDEKHYRAAENAFQRFGKGRHPAGLNMGDCFSYAVAMTGSVPLLFKGRDFNKTDIAIHPMSVLA
jgi:ribonuclease VapC